MDLYIQVGVILLFLAALSLFIYIYTAPAQQFTAKINENNQKINDRLATAEGMDVSHFMNSVSTPGTSVYPLIRDARANKMAILVQTKNSQGLIVNYGYQLRAANTASVLMHPSGNAGSISVTDFEKSFVTTAQSMFNPTAALNVATLPTTPTSIKFGTTAIGAAAASLNKTRLEAAVAIGAATAYEGRTPYTPRVFFSDPTVAVADAQTTGRTFGSTGFMYTDMVIKNDMPVNDNFSYADNPGSLYRFDQNSGYYSTLIINANSEIVGLYVEEHGVNPNSAALANMMLANGTITSLY